MLLIGCEYVTYKHCHQRMCHEVEREGIGYLRGKKDGIGYLRKRLIKGKLVVIKSPSLFKVLAEDIINNCW